ncbi:outer membrane beta-barrel protein [Tellurirhabdus bombi]|uniref:outer membrane beta-barrel protein n=1 Tax=Tellurirhabdus bombi TaxID=2907205 RepID=UPI001F3A6E44|nr:outer membrane beta-barrel protein [Tellurirhabdus bombi]
MKRCLLSLLIMTLGYVTAVAQTKQGKWSAGLQVDPFSLSRKSFPKELFTRTTPTISYFLGRHFEAGLGMPITYAKDEVMLNKQLAYRRTLSSIGFSPFMRIYFGPGKFQPYVGFSYAYAASRHRSQYGEVDTLPPARKGHANVWRGSLGFNYFIKPNIGINVGVNRNWSKFKTDMDQWPFYFWYQENKTTFTLGVQLLFGGKAKVEN